MRGHTVASRPDPISLQGKRTDQRNTRHGEYPAWAFKVGMFVNLLLRVMIVYFAAESTFLPDDPRYAGKGLTIRNILIVVGFTMIFPFHYFIRKKWPRYPVWMDALYLSIFWLDMMGNSFNLFDTFEHFDALPHTWGPGALAVVFMWWQGWSAVSAAGVATMIHAWLECEEYWGDLLFGTHNVRGAWDTVSDLGAGLAGGLAVIIGSWLIVRKRNEKVAPESAPNDVQPIPFPGPRTARSR